MCSRETQVYEYFKKGEIVMKIAIVLEDLFGLYWNNPAFFFFLEQSR